MWIDSVDELAEPVDVVAAAEDHDHDVDDAAAIVGGALAAYLLWQRKKIISNLLEYGVPEMVHEGVHEIEQVTALRNRLTAPIEEVVEASVVKEMTYIPNVKVKKAVRSSESATTYYRRLKNGGYVAPPAVTKMASGVTSQMLEGSYWTETAVASFNKAEEEMAKAIKDQVSRRARVEHVRKKLLALEPGRIAAISETESNAALNAGKQIVAGVRHTLGASDTKTWLTMRDERVRPCHFALHNVTIGRTELFDVCGHLAPHPGFWELPIGLRIRCRCFVLIGGVESDIEYPIPEDLRISV